MISNIAKFGEFIIYTWRLWLSIAILSWLFYDNFIAPKSVVLEEGQFICIESQPFGLLTRCVTYTRNIK